MYADIDHLTVSGNRQRRRTTSVSNYFSRTPYFITFIQKYVTGDIKVFNEYLKHRHVILSLPNWFLRALSAPVFVNNPISGLIILIGLLFGNQWNAICGVFGLFTALLVAVMSSQNLHFIENGVLTSQGLLVGQFLPVFVERPEWSPSLLIPIAIVATFSVLIASCLIDIFGKLELPSLSLPFCVALTAFLASLGNDNFFFPRKEVVTAGRNETFANSSLAFEKVLLAVPCGIAQVYGCTSYITGCIVLIAVGIAQPITMFQFILSGFLSIASALGLAAPPVFLYNGMWTYNCILTSACLGGYFLVFTWQSTLLACIASIFTSCVYGWFSYSSGLPPLLFPTAVVSLIFMSVYTNSRGIVRVPLHDLTYPEEHVAKYRQLLALQDENALGIRHDTEVATRRQGPWSTYGENEYLGDISATPSSSVESRISRF